ncbi:MAG: c-type cytochrome [Opitutaceae bacterium]|nr:c-type cytochrome [Cytophagales bacterium]
MRLILYLVVFLASEWMGSLSEADPYILVQNKPVLVGGVVTFSVTSNTGTDAPYIAWDFGDGSGLGRYKKSLVATYTFNEPGVYQVYARIQGEEIPLSVTQTVYKPVNNPAPTRSSTIQIDNINKKVWVVNADNNSVSCIDALKYTLLKEIPVGKHPRTVAIDNVGNAWVANEDDASISIINSNGNSLNTIKLPYASRPYGICFDPLKNYCFVTLQGSGKLLKIDAKDKKILQSLNVSRSPRGIAVTSNGQKVFVSQFISPEDKGLVREVDAVTMSLKKEIELAFDQTLDFEDRGRGVPNFITSLSITPDGSEIWVPAKKDNTARGMFRDGLPLTFDNTVRTIVSRINIATGTENESLRTDINDADQACAVEFSPYGNIAFVALQGNNRITMLEAATNSRLGLLDSTGLAPQGLVLNADGTRLFVHNFMSRTVKVFNTEDIILSNNFNPVVIATIVTITKENLNPQVLQGKQIFYNAKDERMTFAGYISCASCHVDGGSDERVWDFTERGEGLRNTHSLNGKGGISMGNIHWTSNFDEIQDFENDIRNGFEGKGFLPDSIFNKGTVSDPLGDKKAGLSPELDALAAYVTSLDKIHPSPHRNQDGSLTQEAVAGKKVFAELGCGNCHAGSTFTDRNSGAFHDVGTILTSSGQRRNGNLTGFGTPTLKGVWETAPYLHDGSAPTLRDVFITRNLNKKHGDFTSLSESQIDNLVAYVQQIDESEGTPTGLINQFSYKAQFLEVRPNPSTDFVVLRWKEAMPYGKITIYQTTGLSLYTSIVNGLNEITIDLSNFKAGMYLVDYFDGISKSTAKMVVK